MKFKKSLSNWLQANGNSYSYPRTYKSAASAPVIFYRTGNLAITAVTLAQWSLK